MRTPNNVRRHLFWLSLLVLYLPIQSQESYIQQYLDMVKEYAVIYNGEMEEGYTPALYQNFPYYINPNFASGDLYFNNNLYTNQQLRLDLYKDELIVLVPGKQFNKIIDFHGVDKATIHGVTIVYKDKSSNLSSGYYIQLYTSSSMEMLQKITAEIDKVNLGDKRSFKIKEQFYLIQKGKNPVIVKNKNTFIKLFPGYKKEINSYIKQNNLKFSHNKAKSFAQLAAYCHELTNLNPLL